MTHRILWVSWHSNTPTWPQITDELQRHIILPLSNSKKKIRFTVKECNTSHSVRNGRSSCTKDSGRAHPPWSRYIKHVKFTQSQAAFCRNIWTLEAVAFQKPSRGTSISGYWKGFFAASSFWDSSFTPNVLLSTSVSPFPSLSWLHSLWQINS